MQFQGYPGVNFERNEPNAGLVQDLWKAQTAHPDVAQALVRLHGAIEAMVAAQVGGGRGTGARDEADDDAFVDAVATMLEEAEKTNVTLNMR